MYVINLAALVTGWRWGGHPERFGAATLLLVDMASTLYYRWWIGDVQVGSAADDVIQLLIFGWLTLRSDRWWPFVVTASLALMVMIHFLTIVSDLPSFATTSARVGLWILLYVALLAGVAERWLAGEKTVSASGQWRRRPRSGQLGGMATSRSSS